MYDINRSNLLSVENIKMYLYDLAVLGNAKSKLENQIYNIRMQQNSLGKKAYFNNNELYIKSSNYYGFLDMFSHYIINWILVCLILGIGMVFTAISK